jgi:hypothetical protein
LCKIQEYPIIPLAAQMVLNLALIFQKSLRDTTLEEGGWVWLPVSAAPGSCFPAMRLASEACSARRSICGERCCPAMTVGSLWRLQATVEGSFGRLMFVAAACFQTLWSLTTCWAACFVSEALRIA